MEKKTNSQNILECIACFLNLKLEFYTLSRNLEIGRQSNCLIFLGSVGFPFYPQKPLVFLRSFSYPTLKAICGSSNNYVGQILPNSDLPRVDKNEYFTYILNVDFLRSPHFSDLYPLVLLYLIFSIFPTGFLLYVQPAKIQLEID